MSTALTVAKETIGALSTKFAGQDVVDDLGAGVQGGFGRIGFKGKVWSTNHRGEQRLLVDANQDPIPAIEVVIVKASTVISKTWYEKGYVEGSIEAPDCLSSNGVTPDVSAPKKQATTCALCPRNAWGSQIKQDGSAGKGKACSDTKRLAVVPLPDIQNDLLGGPMLLRVPAASLQDVAAYGAGVAKMGYPYYGVGTRIGFDAKEAFPKFVLRPIRALTDAEAEKVLEHRNDPRTDRILAEDMPVAPAGGAPASAPDAMKFEQASAPTATGFGGAAPAPAAAPVETKPARKSRATAPVDTGVAAGVSTGFGASAPVSAPQDHPAPAPEVNDSVIDAQLDALMKQ
jgi:hypothetical protein